MDILTITVKIAKRSYRLRIKREEEEGIRKAVDNINKSIKAYADNIAYKDELDLLALTALEEKISHNKNIEEKENLEKEIDFQLTEVDKLLLQIK